MMQIKLQNDPLPHFKGKVEKKISGEEFNRKMVHEVFAKFAAFKGKKIVRKEKNNIKATIFFHVAKAVGSSEDEVRRKIKAYISENKPQVLDTARNISKETEMSIDQISAEDFAGLISCKDPVNHKRGGLLKLFKDQQMLKHVHLANYTLAEIVAKVFNVNVTLRDFYIMYDHSFTFGIACEQVRIEAKSPSHSKEIELIQGWAMVHKGVFEKNQDLKFYHLLPVAIMA